MKFLVLTAIFFLSVTYVFSSVLSKGDAEKICQYNQVIKDMCKDLKGRALADEKCKTVAGLIGGIEPICFKDETCNFFSKDFPHSGGTHQYKIFVSTHYDIDGFKKAKACSNNDEGVNIFTLDGKLKD